METVRSIGRWSMTALIVNVISAGSGRHFRNFELGVGDAKFRIEGGNCIA